MDWQVDTSDPALVAQVQERLDELLHRHGADAGARADARQVLGELIANVVRHAPGWAWVSLRWEAGQPLLSVEDDGAGFVPPAPCLPEDLFAEAGRGLFIVAALADQVRVVLGRRSGGARVQVRLFTRAGAGPTAQG